MGYGRCVGQVGALTVAKRMGVSIGVAVLVMAAAVVPMSTVSPAVKLAASTAPCTRTDVTCALILGGTTVPTPDQTYLNAVENHFVGPLYPGQVTYIPVTTPEEAWPATGIGRVVWFVTGSQDVWGLDGPAWPDEPLWKLSGLFDRTFDGSVRDGVTNLEDAIAAHPGESLVIFGYSQGAMVAVEEKRNLDAQYPVGTEGAPDITFVLVGDLNLPNGGFAARFPGLYIPILDVTFNGPEPTDTQFHTVSINQQYDGFADFPLYPLNLLATANALLGALYVHTYDLDLSLADPEISGAIHTTTGDTDYYFFPTEDLPLFAPLRQLGVPEELIDVVEPVVQWAVELGYDRSIDPGEPTPARLFPTNIDPVKAVNDLEEAVGEGVDNAAALVGLPKPPAVRHDDLAAPQRKVGGELATTTDRLNATIGTVKSVIGDGRTIVRSARGENDSPAATASAARNTPVRDAVQNASGDITKVVTKVSDSVKQALSGGNDDDTGDNA
jgi:hypothetical protein